MSGEIGYWVKRASGGKWHLTESVVDDDAVTRCGRRMRHDLASGGLTWTPTMPLTRMIGQPQLCRYCDRGER